MRATTAGRLNLLDAALGPVHLSTAAPERAPAEFLEAAGVLEVQDDQDGDRIVEGLAVPYGERIERPNFMLGTRFLEFAPGAAKWRETAQVFYGHDHLDRGLPIGRVLEASDDGAKGSRVRGRISETSKGNEVYTLLRDGVLDRFSIGFYVTAYEVVDADSADATMRVTEADVFEVSVVPDPAYSTAVVDSVLSNNRKETGMPCATCGQVHAQGVTECQTPTTFASADDVRALTGAIETLERRVETLGQGGGQGGGPAVDNPFPSYGAFLQAVARQDAEALEFLQTMATLAATTDDLGGLIQDGWVGDRYRLVEERRRILNLFSRSPLPAQGMNVEFGQVKPTSDTTQVGKQAAQGDTLPYGKIAFGTSTAPVETYGGWSDMARQVVERSSVAVVERFFDALLNRYAQTTEAAVRAALHNAANAHTLAGTGTHDLTTADGWVDFVVDAATFLDDKGLPVEFLVVSPDIFKSTAKIRTGTNGDYFLDRNNGTIDVPGLSGSVFRVPMTISPSAPTGFVRAGHSSAIRTFEAPGAPFRLQDDDITNLTQAMSVYGYMATAVEDAEALVAPDATV